MTRKKHGLMLGMLAARAVGRAGGMWEAIQALVHGRQAKEFERERRATLLAVPSALTPGTRIVDRRADGSILIIEVPSVLHAPDPIEKSGVTREVLTAHGDRPVVISKVVDIWGLLEDLSRARGVPAGEGETPGDHDDDA